MRLFESLDVSSESLELPESPQLYTVKPTDLLQMPDLHSMPRASTYNLRLSAANSPQQSGFRKEPSSPKPFSLATRLMDIERASPLRTSLSPQPEQRAKRRPRESCTRFFEFTPNDMDGAENSDPANDSPLCNVSSPNKKASWDSIPKETVYIETTQAIRSPVRSNVKKANRRESCAVFFSSPGSESPLPEILHDTETKPNGHIIPQCPGATSRDSISHFFSSPTAASATFEPEAFGLLSNRDSCANFFPEDTLNQKVHREQEISMIESRESCDGFFDSPILQSEENQETSDVESPLVGNQTESDTKIGEDEASNFLVPDVRSSCVQFFSPIVPSISDRESCHIFDESFESVDILGTDMASSVKALDVDLKDVEMEDATITKDMFPTLIENEILLPLLKDQSKASVEINQPKSVQGMCIFDVGTPIKATSVFVPSSPLTRSRSKVLAQGSATTTKVLKSAMKQSKSARSTPFKRSFDEVSRNIQTAVKTHKSGNLYGAPPNLKITEADFDLKIRDGEIFGLSPIAKHGLENSKSDFDLRLIAVAAEPSQVSFENSDDGLQVLGEELPDDYVDLIEDEHLSVINDSFAVDLSPVRAIVALVEPVESIADFLRAIGLETKTYESAVFEEPISKMEVPTQNDILIISAIHSTECSVKKWV